MKAYGRTFGNVIITPTIAQDYSAEVAQATSGVDCMVVVMSETPFLTWNTALQQADTTVKQYGNQGNLNAISAKGAEEVTNGNIISGMYPDISTEPWAVITTTVGARLSSRSLASTHRPSPRGSMRSSSTSSTPSRARSSASVPEAAVLTA